MEQDKRDKKKKVIEDWLNAFPQLSAFSQNKLYKIVGCCVIGIELIKLPHSEEYRPHFVIYALWKKNIKNCLDEPVLMKQLYNKKGLQFNIPYEKHNSYFEDMLGSLEEQIPFSMDGNITLESFFEFVNSCFNDILVKSNSAQQAKLFELEINVALYTGSQTKIQYLLKQIQEESKNWNMQMFNFWYGKFDLWFQNLQEHISNHEYYLDQVENNKQDKKLKQLKCSDFIY